MPEQKCQCWNFLKKLDRTKYEISLYVMMGQGELTDSLPQDIRVLNQRLSNCSVWGKLAGVVRNYTEMLKAGRIRIDKLCWPLVAEGAHRFEESFDLAVAWMEGGSAYYVSKYVKAEKKAAFVHINYESAGYTPHMDQNCWEQFGRIF